MELEIIKQEEVSAIIANTPLVLEKNNNLLQRALGKSNELLQMVEQIGMDDEIDAQINDWQVKAKEALKVMNQRRSPITQMLDNVKKLFTEQEGLLDPKKPESNYFKLQNLRNNWASKKAEIQRQREAEILRQQNEKKELVDLQSAAELEIRTHYNNKLSQFKTAILTRYNDLTIENETETRAKIQGISAEYPLDKFNEITPQLTAFYTPADKVAEIITAARKRLYPELHAHFQDTMTVEKQNYLDLIPSRIAELKAIASANAEQKKALEAEAEKRKAEEAKRIQEEALQAQKAMDEKIQAEKAMQQTEIMFESTAALAEVVTSDSAKTRAGYKIEIKNKSGYGAIFIFYMEKCADTLTTEALGKVSLNQMVMAVEKYSHKMGVLVQSENVAYKTVYKAIASKN